MSVPLDRLYNHLDGLCNHDILIYRFYPHGSKKLTDLIPLSDVKDRDWIHQIKNPGAICHDQEPLFFDQYSQDDILNYFIHFAPSIATDPELVETITTLITAQHIRSVTGSRYSVYDKTLLVHSEKNSHDLMRYENAGFIGVYWWSHAAIAADWYRYAQHDMRLIPNFGLVKKDFLIYNRAWSGTREYRLKFTECIVKSDLQDQCLITFNPECESGHYLDFVPKNSVFAIQQTNLEEHFKKCTVDGTASADYNNQDYQSTAIELVLETLFDDTRWHLTEKSLRPIACGRPFMLAATPGSLQYLREYGFKTFNGHIDESYDTVQDPVKRLETICAEMKRITLLPEKQKLQLWNQLYEIAESNKKLFFSRTWQQSIFDEFATNLNYSLTTLEHFKNGERWKSLRDAWNKDPSKIKLNNEVFLKSMQHQDEVKKLFKQYP